MAIKFIGNVVFFPEERTSILFIVIYFKEMIVMSDTGLHHFQE